MEYSLDFTKNHPLSKRSLESLNTIIKKEGGKGVFKVTTLAINLDNVERELHKSQLSNTMDTALGVVYPNNTYSILLCEFKLKVKYPKNLRGENLKSKVSYSNTLLRENYSGLIEKKNYFLFENKYKNQAKNTISRIFNNRVNEFEVLTEKEFAKLLNANI